MQGTNARWAKALISGQDVGKQKVGPGLRTTRWYSLECPMAKLRAVIRRGRLLGTGKQARFARVSALVVGLAGLCLTVLVLRGGDPPADNSPRTTIALAVLGDSSSHSYQDSLSFPSGSSGRGGAFRARTFQWIEVLARLRANELNPGPWVEWGRSTASSIAA